jgi:hypothetical protein
MYHMAEAACPYCKNVTVPIDEDLMNYTQNGIQQLPITDAKIFLWKWLL